MEGRRKNLKTTQVVNNKTEGKGLIQKRTAKRKKDRGEKSNRLEKAKITAHKTVTKERKTKINDTLKN